MKRLVDEMLMRIMTTIGLSSLLLVGLSVASAQQPTALKRDAWSYIEGRADVFAETNQTIWSAAEGSLQEFQC